MMGGWVYLNFDFQQTIQNSYKSSYPKQKQKQAHYNLSKSGKVSSIQTVLSVTTEHQQLPADN